jgi:hypothetical protein
LAIGSLHRVAGIDGDEHGERRHGGEQARTSMTSIPMIVGPLARVP